MKIKMILLGFMLTTAIYLPANPPSEEGKSIFLARCAACHNVNKPLKPNQFFVDDISI